MRRVLTILSVIFAMLLAAPQAGAQYFTAGSEPPGIKLKSLEYDNYSVIYPEGLDSLARRYLYLLEKNRRHAVEGMKIGVNKIPVVLHPFAISGNSTAAWGPKRLEIFTTPDQGGLPINYEEYTSLRTSRLLGYMAHYDTHTFHFFQHFLFGQHTVALGVGFYPSVWQSVGDAALFVGDETQSGQGRNGEFLMPYRAAFVENDIRSYDHWRYGSYRDFTPPTEAFGYIINSNMRFYSGNYYAMADVLNAQMRDFWDFFGYWNKSFLEGSNKTVRKHWRFISAFYPTIWSDDYLERGPYTATEPLLAQQERLFTDFRNIVRSGDNLIATKQGMQYPRQLVQIDTNGRQKRLSAFSEKTGRLVTGADGKVYWNEEIPDPRWELRSSSIVRCYDPATRRISDITHGTRYFNPTVSESGDSLLVAEYLLEGGSDCVIIDSRSGAEINRIAAPKGSQITELAYSGGRIYAVVKNVLGAGIYSTRPDTGVWRCEIDEQSSGIRDMSVSDGCINFICDRDGIFSIYRYSLAENRLQKLTNARFGQFSPLFEPSGDIICADYDRLGYHPVRIKTDSLLRQPLEMERDARQAFPMAEHLSDIAHRTLEYPEEELYDDLRNDIDSLRPEVYRKTGKLFKFHSWAPFYASINRIMAMSYEEYYQLAGLGATVISQNTLGTAVTQLGYEYHDHRHTGHVNFNYSGWYPVIELTADFNDHSLLNKGEGKPMSIDASANIYIPWNFSKGGWNRGLVPYFKTEYCNDGIYNLTYGARWYSMLAKSKRQLSPRLGIGIEYDGRKVFNPLGTRDLSYLYAYGYLPGITRDQTLKLSVAHQHQWNRDEGQTIYFLNNNASMPRGYKSSALSDYTKFTADYGIFVYLGDVTWPWLYYLHRAQIVPFFDFAINRPQTALLPDKGTGSTSAGSITQTPQYLYSYGADILIGGHFFRIGSEINIGLRYARTAEGRNSFGVIFGTNMK